MLFLAPAARLTRFRLDAHLGGNDGRARTLIWSAIDFDEAVVTDPHPAVQAPRRPESPGHAEYPMPCFEEFCCDARPLNSIRRLPVNVDDEGSGLSRLDIHLLVGSHALRTAFLT